MIYYRLRGHELQNDVQTMVQVFYPNLHYYRTEEISAEETTVESSVEKGIASAMLYRRGEQVSAWSVPYTEPLTEKTSGEADYFRSFEQRNRHVSQMGAFDRGSPCENR